MTRARGQIVRPQRRLLERVGLPTPHRPERSLARQLVATLTDPQPATRLAKATAPNRKAIGPFQPPQRFTRPAMGPNTPESMEPGLSRGNARRLVGKTPRGLA